MAKIDRKKMKQQLVKRTEESNTKTENQGGGGWEYYLNIPKVNDEPFPIYSLLKKATEVKKPVEHFFNIVPFEIGHKYPNQDWDFQPGDWTYFLDLWVHKNVGPENKRLVCPKFNYGKRCPICEHLDEQLKDATTKEERRELYKEFKPMRRSIYFIRVSEDNVANEEYNKGVQVMDIAYNWMEKELQKAATLPRGGGLIPYADPDEGREIMVVVTKQGEGYYDVDQHRFIERDYVIEDDEIEQTFSLDECIVLHPYDKISSIFYGEDEDEEEDEGSDEGVGDDVPLNAEDHNQPEQEEAAEDNGDSGDDPVDEDTPNECPVGGEFGEDYSMFNECDSCEFDDPCKMKKRSKKKPAPKKATPKKEAPKKESEDKPASGKRKRPQMKG